MPEAVIEARGAEVRYAAGREPALQDAHLAVAPGELVGVLGPNGAGKSTLLRVLSGVLAPTRGTVHLFGEELGAIGRREVARRVAMVAQQTDVTFGFTVLEVVMMGRAPHQDTWMRAGAEDERVVARTLERCDLSALASRRVDELSGGEQKRVAVARALAQEPRVLLLDEPGAFLDVRHQVALYGLLTDLAADEHLAVVVSMHDLNAAAEYATRVVLAKGGRFVAVGTVEEVMTYRQLKETFDADLYCGVNDLTGSRFFLPMRARPSTRSAQ